MIALAATPSQAQENYRANDTVSLGQEETITGNYFTAGDNVIVAGTVNGDAYVAGGTVVIDGTINGDLLVAGGTVTIAGTVTGDVRAAGGTLNVSGTIGQNLTAVGGTIRLERAAQLSGSLVTAGGTVETFAPVPNGISAAAGMLYITEDVGGDIVAAVGDMTIAFDPIIAGDVTYYSEQEAYINADASISGTVSKRAVPVEMQNRERTASAAAGAEAGAAGFVVGSFLTSLAAGLLLIKVFPVFTARVATQIEKQPLSALLVGLGVLVLMPLIAIVLILTMIGIPLGVLVLVGYGFALYLAHIFTAMFIGKKIYQSLSKTKNAYLAFALGLLVLTLVTIIPVVGWMVGFFSMLVGLGALLQTKKLVYGELRGKKLI